METLVVLIAAAVLSMQIALESSLAYSIKRFFFLDIDRLGRLHTLSKILFWDSFWGIQWMYLLRPISILISFFFRAYKVLNELMNCQYCLSFHIAWVMLYLLGHELINSLLLGLTAIIITKIYERI